MPDLLFEIGTEELPGWYVLQARTSLAEELERRLERARLPFKSVSSYATPRRVAAVVRGLAEASESREELRRGPAKAAAFDSSGQPSKAAMGFARSVGVDASELVLQDTDKGSYVFASVRSGGETAREILPALLSELIGQFPAPRKMHWSDVSTPFLRPVAWVLALLGDTPLKFDVAGVTSGSTSRGHRFLADRAIRIASPADYLTALEDAYVVAEPEARAQRTLEAAREAAAKEGLEVVWDSGLLAEVSNLLEWPVGVLGSFERKYLELPEEVLTTTMIHHQNYFPTRTKEGKLAPYFVSLSNNRVPDEDVIRKGYEGVLAGRLYDALFFYESDRRKPLAEHATALNGIGFQKDLGSMADKVARSAKLARHLADLLELGEEEKSALSGAAPLYRADLATQMVFELPELEGVMARAYAEAEGYPQEVALALEHGVRPQNPEAPLPERRVGAVLSVADRLDKLVGFFALGRRPSGSADPFGLRRDASSVARVLNAQGWASRLETLIAAAAAGYEGDALNLDEDTQQAVSDFIWERVTSLLAEEGISTLMMRAAKAGNPAVITAARRAHLLQALSLQDDFATLLTLYKRAANLAERAPADASVQPQRFETEHERALHDGLERARQGIEALLARASEALRPWDLGKGPKERLTDIDSSVAEVLSLKAPLDRFLDHVLVMVEDETVRNNRLALLVQVRDALRGLGALEALEGALLEGRENTLSRA